jgi:cell division protein FtsI/penicillin-binding protein 2
VIGQLGAEAAFEPVLHGTWGGQQVEVDSAGRIISILGDKPAIAGQDVQLTLDLELQRAAEAALGTRRGSHCGNGSPQWSDSGHGQLANLRSQYFYLSHD